MYNYKVDISLRYKHWQIDWKLCFSQKYSAFKSILIQILQSDLSRQYKINQFDHLIIWNRFNISWLVVNFHEIAIFGYNQPIFTYINIHNQYVQLKSTKNQLINWLHNWKLLLINIENKSIIIKNWIGIVNHHWIIVVQFESDHNHSLSPTVQFQFSFSILFRSPNRLSLQFIT